MTDAETLRFIRSEIARQLNVILHGESKAGASIDVETIQNLFPGSPPIEDRPLMHPYGFASKAPDGTIQVVARVGEHPGNRMVMGHRSADRPSDLEGGEAALYSASGFSIRAKNGQLEVGKGGTYEPVVLGDKLEAVLIAILDAIIQHTHPAPGAPPTNAAAFSSIKSGQVEDGKLLVKEGGGV